MSGRAGALAIPFNGSGWIGNATSDDVGLKVVAPSTDPTRHQQRLIALANEALLEGATADAAQARAWYAKAAEYGSGEATQRLEQLAQSSRFACAAGH